MERWEFENTLADLNINLGTLPTMDVYNVVDTWVNTAVESTVDQYVAEAIDEAKEEYDALIDGLEETIDKLEEKLVYYHELLDDLIGISPQEPVFIERMSTGRIIVTPVVKRGM